MRLTDKVLNCLKNKPYYMHHPLLHTNFHLLLLIFVLHDLDTLELYLYSRPHHPEDAHMSGRNMSVVNV